MKTNQNIPLELIHEYLKEHYYSKFTPFMPKNHCSDKNLRGISSLILSVYCRNKIYQHDGDFKTGAYILAIASDFKREKFGRHFNDINFGLGSIFELAIPADRTKKIANGYRLSKHLYPVLEQFEMEYEQGNIRIPSRKYQGSSKPIMSKFERKNEDNTTTMVNAKVTHGGHGLPTVIPTKQDALWTLITVARKILPNVFTGVNAMHYMFNGTLDKIRNGLESEEERKVFDNLVGDARGYEKMIEMFQRIQRIKAYALCMHAISTAFGGIPIKYKETRNGRLYALDEINLQNAPRIVRKAALSGCFDLDFENCHYSILFNMAKTLGCTLKTVKHYLENKAEVRNTLAKDLDLPVEDVKTALLSMLFGAQFRKNVYNLKNDDEDISTAMFKLLGEKLDGFKDHPLIKKLRGDIRKATKVILDEYEHKTKRGRIVNAFKSEMVMKDTRTDSGRRSQEYSRKALSFLLQGQERVMLDIVIRNLDGPKIMLLQHDGLTYTEEVSRAELDRIEAIILEKTGMTMKIGDSEPLNTFIPERMAQNTPTFNIAA